jgi:cyclopropane fatty-acyl-phospholipid synthase-like methyltransferase
MAMNSIQNSPKQWDALWGKPVFRVPGGSIFEAAYRKAIYFSAFDKLLHRVNLNKPTVLELGSGTGNNSLYIAQKYQADAVSLVDFSEAGLAKVEKEKFPCAVEAIQEDLLAWEPSHKYDFVHSTGLIEHFQGEQRLAVIQKHANAAREGGYVMIWVPVKSFAFMFIGRFNKYMGIQEIAFTEQELRLLCEKSGLHIVNEGNSALGALFGVIAQKTYEN